MCTALWCPDFQPRPDGVFTIYTFDRTQEQTKDAQGALMRTLSRTYDTLGQLQALTDAYGRNTTFTYRVNGYLATPSSRFWRYNWGNGSQGPSNLGGL